MCNDCTIAPLVLELLVKMLGLCCGMVNGYSGQGIMYAGDKWLVQNLKKEAIIQKVHFFCEVIKME